MVRLIAIDDESHALQRFKRIAERFSDIEICGLFDDAEELLNLISKNEVDAVFLDIEMPDRNGLFLAEEILNISPHIDIVFLTAYNQFAVDAFELNAVDYLLKPVTYERLEKTIRRIKQKKTTTLIVQKPTITCFGAFSISVEGNVLSWRNQKAKEMMAYLIHRDGIPVSWDKITEALWYNMDYQKAQANLHTTMYRLRKHLAEAGISHIIDNNRGNYKVNKNEIICDYYDYMNTRELPQGSGGYFEDDGYTWAISKAAEIDGYEK